MRQFCHNGLITYVVSKRVVLSFLSSKETDMNTFVNEVKFPV